MGHESLVARLPDGFHDGGVVEFLRSVELVPARTTSGVVVRVVGGMLENVGHDIPLHDLHMINIAEELKARGTQLLAESQTPVAPITLVIGMIDSRIEKLHHQRHIVLFGECQKGFEPPGTVLKSFLVGQAFPVA